MPPTLRKGKGLAVTSKNKMCPTHKMPLHYDAATGYWHCQNTVCNYRLVPKADAERGSATVDQGPFELFVFTDSDNVTNYLIRSLKSNIIFNITDHMKKVRGGPNNMTVEMFFDNIAIKE